MDENQKPNVENEDKLTDWENEPTLLSLKDDLQQAKPYHDEQVQKIKKWQDFLEIKGEAKPTKVKGRSSVQPRLIRRQAEWRYSALSEPFLGTPDIFTVEPRTFEDEEAARQNQILLNWQFTTKMNKVRLIDEYVHACVDEGTAILKLSWVRETHVEQIEVPVYEYYPIQDEMQMQQLQQAMQLEQQNPRQYNETVPDEIKEAVTFFKEEQIPVIAIPIGTEMQEKEMIDENRPNVEVINPVNVFIDPSCNGDLSKALFVINTFETNKAELEKAGIYQNLDQVDWEGATISADPDHETTTPDNFKFDDTSRKKIIVYEYWGYYDIYNDGTLHPFVASWIGNTMIRMAENPFPDEKIPFVVVNYLPVKRHIYGEADAEILIDNQKILGAVTRGMIDSLGRSANGQQGFAKGMLDPLNRRKFENGEDYEFNPSMSPNGGLIEHKYPDLPQSALTLIEMQNNEAEAITGVKAFSGGLAGDSYGTRTATATRGVLDAASKREMSILRRLAYGMAQVAEKIIAMNSVFLTEEEVVRVTNRTYIEIKREDLKGNFDVKVDISTAEEDNAKAQDLGFMLQTIGPNIDVQITMLILSEIADLKRMPGLAEKLRNYQPQPDPAQEQAKQLQLQKLQAETEKLQAEAVKAQAEAQKAMADAQVNAANAQVGYQKTQAEVQGAMAKAQREAALAEKANQEAQKTAIDNQMTLAGTKHLQDMQHQQAQAKGNQNLEILKALLKPRKPDESEPDIEAGIGFNAISDQLANSNLL